MTEPAGTWYYRSDYQKEKFRETHYQVKSMCVIYGFTI